MDKNTSDKPDDYTQEEKSWDELVLSAGGIPHYMQSSAWNATKLHSPWPSTHIIVKSPDFTMPLQVFSRTVPGLGRLHYAPNVSGITSSKVAEITKFLSDKYRRGLAFKLELYQPYSEKLIKEFVDNGWLVGNSVQHRDTVIVDMNCTEDELLAKIKKRARYEVRVGIKNNLKVDRLTVTQERLDTLTNLINVTAERSGAFFRSSAYANKYWHAFAAKNQGTVYFARHGTDILAGAYVIHFGKASWYKDGGSVRDKSEMFAPRYLQWGIMQDLMSRGIKTYDLSGIPAREDVQTSSLKGLYTFKTGFATEQTKLMPALELPIGKRYRLWPKSERQFLRLYSGLKKDFWY